MKIFPHIKLNPLMKDKDPSMRWMASFKGAASSASTPAEASSKLMTRILRGLSMSDNSIRTLD